MAARTVIDNQLNEAKRTVGEPKPMTIVARPTWMEPIQQHQQLNILGLFGGIDYDASYDYKAQRRGARGTSAAGV
jgi:hypothetical protein